MRRDEESSQQGRVPGEAKCLDEGTDGRPRNAGKVCCGDEGRTTEKILENSSVGIKSWAENFS